VQRLVGREAQLALQPVALGLELGLAPGQLLRRGRGGVLVGLVHHLADLVVGPGHFRLETGPGLDGFPLGPVRLVLGVGDVPLALVEAGPDLRPGEAVQQEEQDQEDDERPDGQVEGAFENVEVRVGVRDVGIDRLAMSLSSTGLGGEQRGRHRAGDEGDYPERDQPSNEH